MKSILSLIPVLFLMSCGTDPGYTSFDDGQDTSVLNLPEQPYNYSNIQLPAYFNTNDGGLLPSAVTGIDNTPQDNPITDDGATLGRVLFYDRNLSLNRSTACASCHRPEAAFADSSPFSSGLYGGKTKRNSISLINSRFYKRGRFFYDERASSLEAQVLMPMLDHTEMDMTADLVLQRVREQDYYADLFVKAFGSGTVSSERIASALSQFIRSIVSFKSKYDEGRAQVSRMVDPFPNFSVQENRGKELFLKSYADGGVSCYACHTTEGFVAPPMGMGNNGLDALSVNDLGAYSFYGNESLKGAFKIPTLRNIVHSAPYMHDGRFRTLRQVIEFYNNGVQPHPNLSPLLKGVDGLPRKLNLSENDIQALIAFLYTLNDTSLQSDPRWLDPFINQHL
ncbi:cytochrome-c peroxidase [Flavobacterium sp. RNTU_13]|uniref:cytochrome-c peroxidase n=1 Tax=Flavobacterium sp. RNTU_13 TaxID=3375145 RepID=UPI0039867DB0